MYKNKTLYRPKEILLKSFSRAKYLILFSIFSTCHILPARLSLYSSVLVYWPPNQSITLGSASKSICTKRTWLHYKRIFCRVLLFYESPIPCPSLYSFCSLSVSHSFLQHIIRCKTVNSIYLSNISCSHGFIRLHCIVTQTQARKMTQHRTIFSFNPRPTLALSLLPARNNKLRWSFSPALCTQNGQQNEKYVAHGRI